LRSTWLEGKNPSIFQVEVFWVVTPCSFVVGYQHAASILTARRHNSEDLELIYQLRESLKTEYHVTN